MKNITQLTSNEARGTCPTDCAYIDEKGLLLMGAIQMPIPEIDSWPSGYDLEREAQARFGAVRINDGEPSDDDETVTWLVVRS